MASYREESLTCQICGKRKRINELLPAELVAGYMPDSFRGNYPDFDTGGYVCKADVHRIRALYLNEILKNGMAEITVLDDKGKKSISEQELSSRNVNKEFDSRRTTGERVSDALADFLGSWTFIVLFTITVFVWILLNAVILIIRPFDPYPFIFLNLVLSCLAAIQAPIIIMSQNRQAARDRMEAENDFRVNLKAELGIRHLHEKIDYLLMTQWQRLLEVQKMQMDRINELEQSLKSSRQRNADGIS